MKNLFCVECQFTTDSRGDGNEHEFDEDHHVMDIATFRLAAEKLSKLVP